MLFVVCFWCAWERVELSLMYREGQPVSDVPGVSLLARWFFLSACLSIMAPYVLLLRYMFF